MTTLRISQLAERSGVPATTLRFYETAGLLPAERTPAGYRMYGEEAVERLAFIDAAKHLGLSLEEIAGLLAVWESGACAEVKADLRPRLAARLANAERRTTELAAFTASLHRALEHLDALPDRSERCDPECGFLGPDLVAQPVACSLSADGLGERAAQWQQLTEGVLRQQIPDGLRLSLPSARAADIAALAAAEQQCCPFFDFRLHLDGEHVHLEVRAPAEGAEMLAGLFAAPAS